MKIYSKLESYTQIFFLLIAITLSIGSFIYLIVKDDIILNNFWINDNTGELITYIGILATSALSILIYFTAANTLKMNKKLYLIEEFRFKKEILPLKKKISQAVSLIQKVNEILELINIPLEEYRFTMDILESDEFFKESQLLWEKNLDTYSREEQWKRMFDETFISPFRIENIKIQNTFIEDFKNTENIILDLETNLRKLEDILYDEQLVLLNLRRYELLDILNFYSKPREKNHSLKSAYVNMKNYKDLGIVSDVPYYSIFEKSSDEIVNFRKDINQIRKEINIALNKWYV